MGNEGWERKGVVRRDKVRKGGVKKGRLRKLWVMRVGKGRVLLGGIR